MCLYSWLVEIRAHQNHSPMVILYLWILEEFRLSIMLAEKFSLFIFTLRIHSPATLKGKAKFNPKGNQSWLFIGRTEAEAPILWPPDAKNWLIGKDPDAGKDWRQEKGTTEDEMVGWPHRLDGHELEQAPGVGDGQGGVACFRFMGSQRVGHWETELKMYHWMCALRLVSPNFGINTIQHISHGFCERQKN